MGEKPWDSCVSPVWFLWPRRAWFGLVVVEREYARDEVLIQELAARV